MSSASSPDPARRFNVLDGGGAVDAEYAKDQWDAHILGVTARRGHNLARFDTISQPWLRDAVKRWSRFRLASGYAFLTIAAGAKGLARFSTFLGQHHHDVVDHTSLSRAVIEDYLSWIASLPLAASTRSLALGFLKGFLDWAHRYHSLPGLAASAVIYHEEVIHPDDAVPRFVPEFVMAQLESETNLAAIPDISTRHLVVVLIETGLRGGDACELPFNPMFDDSVGWPCLRFHNSKVGAEQLIPLSAKAAAAIRAQQAHVADWWPGGSPWLFPGILENPDGAKPYAHASLSGQLGRWQAAIDVRDEAGRPVRVHAHQFRHTVGTRLINKGVPQHVVQKLLGHASPRMTARYAQIHDHTIREAFEAYCAQRVDTAGRHLPYDPGAVTADAEWAKHNLGRIADSLPNGYCGRPPQQDCPHPNACLTCPDFQTTPEFLDVHRQQAATNRKLIARADADGRFRLADNLRQVQTSLDRIIPALEQLTDEPGR